MFWLAHSSHLLKKRYFSFTVSIYRSRFSTLEVIPVVLLYLNIFLSHGGTRIQPGFVYVLNKGDSAHGWYGRVYWIRCLNQNLSRGQKPCQRCTSAGFEFSMLWSYQYQKLYLYNISEKWENVYVKHQCLNIWPRSWPCNGKEQSCNIE